MVRFKDPGEIGSDGQPQPVIDIMLPFGPYQVEILKSHVIIDEKSGNRLPTIESGIVSKYAAVVSPYRSFEKKEQDAVDLRRLIKTNHDAIDMDKLTSLATLIWENGEQDIQRFVELAVTDQPFR